MILLVDMNCRRDSLGFYEFVLPIVHAIGDLDVCTVRHYREVTPDDVKKSSCVILSGTPLKDHATLSEPEKFGWLKSCATPVLGICAGMQTIALVFGAELEKCLSLGMTRIVTTATNSLFSSAFQAYTLHNYSLKSSGDFEVLAESEKCVQAIKKNRREIYGVLFHPEVRNPEIIKRFVRASSHTE